MSRDTEYRLLTTVSQRKFHPKFTLDIPKTVTAIEKARTRDRAAMMEIIGVDKHQPSHAWYFKCYERMDVHRTMINDQIRTGSYLMAISRNKHILKDKVVLDVGTGSGVLSIFAVKEGLAKKVIAVDASAIVKGAERLIRSSGLEGRITVVRERIEDLRELPDGIGLVDAIVSEWMGYGLFNESVLHGIIVARQRFLKDGGYMLPDMAKLRVLGSTFTRDCPVDEKVIKAHEALRQVAPLDLSLLPAVDDCFAVNALVISNQILTDASVLKVIDMYTVQHDEVNVNTGFTLTCERHGIFRSFVLFFDVLFDLPNSWMFSTSPESPPTHWLQTVCCLPPDEEFEVWRDTVISGRISMNPIQQLPRFWTVTIAYSVTWKKKSAISRTRTFYLM